MTTTTTADLVLDHVRRHGRIADLAALAHDAGRSPKAVLELVALGVSSAEREFLADLMLPDGRTMHRALAEQVDASYKTGAMPPLLGMGGNDG